jgi:glycosyltransferase 2 family protein
MKRAALVGLKVAVSLALLAYLFSVTDMHALEERVRSADLLMLVAAVACYMAMLAFATWRWRLLLETLGVDAPMRQLLSSYLVATFFNNFLPSNIGGDVVRVRDGSRLTGSTAASLAVVGIDRILGFGALYALAASAFVLGGPVERELAGARVVLGGFAIVFLGLSYLFFKPGTARALLAASRLDRIPWALGQFEAAQAAVRSYRESVGSVMLALGASLAIQTLAVWYYVCVARALSIPLPLTAAFLMVPLCTLLQAVPISFNGWGLREGLFTVYFAQVGLPRSSGLAFSLVGAGLTVLLSLSGAIAWLARSRPVPAPDVGA